MKDFSKKLALVPNKPGSYQMKNSDGVIIYVGKAKNLNKRLRSYFNKNVTGKTRALVENIDDFDYIVTSSELESLILEINLIKKYDPKYNILLRDDKSYPYIELTHEKYPMVRVVRNVKRKRLDSNLFGPYPNAGAARRTVEIINRVYPLRKCRNLGKELCLYYHLGECLGYCVKKIDETIINDMVDDIKKFLRGDSSVISDKLKIEMDKASNAMNYEKAKELRDMLDDINTTLKKQKIDLINNKDVDIFNYSFDNNYLSIECFYIRGGVLFGRDNKIINYLGDVREAFLEYITVYYDKRVKPKEVIVPEEFDTKLLSEYLDINVTSPSKGKFKKLMDLVKDNSKEQLELKIDSLEKDDKRREKAVNELKKILGIDKASRIEAFDNSHLFGTYYVGGMVVFDDFLPLKNEYRKFKLDIDVKDDLAAMREVLYRRYYRVLVEDLVKPDLIIMDGGKTQIRVCKEILNSLHLDIPILGLVKSDKHSTNKLMNSNYEIIDIGKDSDLFLFLTRIQDEVHRYAISYHRNIKAKGALASKLDLIEGIGEVRRKKLIKRFGSYKKISEASLEDLMEVLPEDVSKKVYSSLRKM